VNSRRYIGCPFFPNRDSWDDFEPLKIGYSLNGFSVPCSLDEIRVHKGMFPDYSAGGDIYATVKTTSDNIILDIDATVYVTLSERSSDQRGLSSEGKRFLNKQLEECTYSKIDFLKPDNCYPKSKFPLRETAKEYFIRAAAFLESVPSPQKDEVKKNLYLIGMHITDDNCKSLTSFNSALEHLDTNFKYVHQGTSEHHLCYPEKRAKSLARLCKKLMISAKK
jgi:hypothetical protein